MQSGQNTLINILKQLGIAMLSYAFLLLCLGYHFGDGDHVEVIPLVQHTINPDLFSSDFFVQQYLVHGYGVRDGMVRLSLLGMDAMPLSTWYLLLHLATSLVLLLGCIHVLQFLTRDMALSLLCAGTVLGLFYGFNLGGNEIYYPQTLPSLLSKSLLIWGIYFWLCGKTWLWPLLVVAGGNFQMIAAAQVGLLCMGTSVLYFGWRYAGWRQRGRLGERPKIDWWSAVLLLIYLILLSRFAIGTYQAMGSGENRSEFLDLLLWRVPHHFDPFEFGSYNFLLVGLGSLAGMYVLYYRQRRMFLFCALAITGCMIYALTYHSLPQMLLTQWFKTTIWVKWLCLSGLFIAVYDAISRRFTATGKVNFNAALLCMMLIAGIVKGPLTGARYDLPGMNKEVDDEIAVAKLAKQLTPEDALFLIPPNNTSFKIVAQRSCYVDYKSTVFDPLVLSEWHRRIQQVYGISAQSPSGIHRMAAMKQGYLQTLNDPALLQALGITHFISDTSIDHYRLLGNSGRWHLYSVALSDSGNENL